MGVVHDKSFQFALNIIHVCEEFNPKISYKLIDQLLRAGTSIGANIRESKRAESSADFIHKLSIAQKECEETMYWLELFFAAEYIGESKFKALYSDAEELMKLLSSIIKSKREAAAKF